jgi:hypothetical protein
MTEVVFSALPAKVADPQNNAKRYWYMYLGYHIVRLE